MKKNIIYVIVFGGFLVFIFFNLVGLPEEIIYQLTPGIANATSVTVSANVTVTVTCATNISTTDFGTLVSTAVATSTPNASTSMSCANAAAGCVMLIEDTGTSTGAISGLSAPPAGAIIESPNLAQSATATLAAGTEGFGLQATTTTAGSGAALTIGARYLLTAFNDANNIVGGASTTALTLATANTTTSQREVVVRHKAAITSVTPGGSYTDTLIYNCSQN